MSSILTLDELASLPKPDIAPDPVHRMIYFLKAIEAFMQGELCADSAEKHEHLCNFWGDYWQSFWKTYVAFDDAVAYLRGDAAIFVKQHGLNAQEHIQQLDFIATGIVRLTRRFLLRAQQVDLERHRHAHQFIRESIANLRVLLELMGISFIPCEKERPARKPETDVPSTKGKGKRKRINERMLSQLHKEPNSLQWSARDWAFFLHCSPSSVHNAPAWESCRNAKALSQAQRIENRFGVNYKKGKRVNRKESREE